MSAGDTLRKFLQQKIRPGSIWLLPANHRLDYLPERILHEDGKIYRETAKQHRERFWHEKDFIHYKSARGESVINVEVRPFLAISYYSSIQDMNRIKLPRWFANSITGFPITKVEHIEREDIGFTIEDLHQNKIEHIHYLPKSTKNGLSFDSYIPLPAIMPLDVNLFTHSIGYLDEGYLEEILRKFNDLHTGR